MARPCHYIYTYICMYIYIYTHIQYTYEMKLLSYTRTIVQ